MKRRNREFSIFNLSMLDVMTGALGAVMLILIVLLTQKIGEESMSCQDIKEELIAATTKLEETKTELKETKRQLNTSEIEEPEAAERVSFITRIIDSTAGKISWTVKQISEIQKELFQEEPEEDLMAFKIPRKVVMIVDLSGSMAPDGNKYNEDRLSQVKAALKMFIVGMDQEYYIDIVYFPAFEENINKKLYPDFKIKPEQSGKCKEYEMRDEAYDNPDLNCYKYGYFEGELKRIESESDKYGFYKKIECLQAYHGTPTIPVLEFILSGSRYNDAEGLVLFSDGQPDSMKRKSYTGKELLKRITEMNRGRKKIFSVGIGTEFRNQEDSDAVEFLKKLARQNDGFYIGF